VAHVLLCPGEEDLQAIENQSQKPKWMHWIPPKRLELVSFSPPHKQKERQHQIAA